MSGHQLMLVAGALAIIGVERLVNALLIVSRDDHNLAVRLLTALVCVGAAPVLFLLGYLKVKTGQAPSHRRGRDDA